MGFLSYRQFWHIAVALMLAVTVATVTTAFVDAAPNSGSTSHAQQKEEFKRECIEDKGGRYIEGKTAFDAPYFGCKEGDHHEICVETWFQEEGRDACYEFTTPSRGTPADVLESHPSLDTDARVVHEAVDPGAGDQTPELEAHDLGTVSISTNPNATGGEETPCKSVGKWCRVVCDTNGLCDWVCTDCIGQPATAEVMVTRAVEHSADQPEDQQLVAGDRGDSSPPTAASKPKKDEFKDNFKGGCENSTYDGKPATYSESSDGKYRCTLPSGTIVQCDPVAVDLLGGWKGCTVIPPSSDNGKPATQEPNRPTVGDDPQLAQHVETEADETDQTSDDIVSGDAPQENATAAQGHEANGQQIASVDGASHTAAASEEDADDA